MGTNEGLGPAYRPYLHNIDRAEWAASASWAELYDAYLWALQARQAAVEEEGFFQRALLMREDMN